MRLSRLTIKRMTPSLFYIPIFFVSLFWVWLLTRVPLDDTYIYFRYAENFAKGLGPVFNPGEMVEGYSGFSWFFLLAMGACMGLPLDCFAQALSIGAYLFTSLSLYWYGARNYPNSFKKLLFPILFAASPATAFWAGMALETLFYGLLILLCFLSYLYLNQSRWQRIFTGLLACLIGMSRPEGIAVYVYLLFFETLSQLVQTRRINMIRLCEYAAGLLLFIFFLLSRHQYYGEWLPNTFYVKVSMNENFWHRGIAYLFEFINSHIGGKFILAALFLHGILFRRTEKEWWCLSLFILGFFLIVIQSGGDWWPFTRHALPIYPLIVMLLGKFFARAFSQTQGKGWSLFTRMTIGLLLLVTIFSNMNSVLMSSRRFPKSIFTPDYNRAFQTYAHFYGLLLNKILLPGQTLALAPIPFVSYYYHGPVLDTLGLTDHHIAHRNMPLGGMTHSHEKGDGNYVLQMRPTLLRFFGHLDLYSMPLQYPKPSDVYFVSDREILAHPDFEKLYEPLPLKVRNLYVMFWKLRGDIIKNISEEEINALYDETIGQVRHWPQDDFLELLYSHYNRIENTFFFKVYAQVRSLLSGL